MPAPAPTPGWWIIPLALLSLLGWSVIALIFICAIAGHNG